MTPEEEEIEIEATARARARIRFEQEQGKKSLLGGPSASIGLPKGPQYPPTLINKGINRLNQALDFVPTLGPETIPYMQDPETLDYYGESGMGEMPAESARSRAANLLQTAIPTASAFLGGGYLSPATATAGDAFARKLNKELGLTPYYEDEFSDYKKLSLENPLLLNATLGYGVPAAKAVKGFAAKSSKVFDPILNPQRLAGDALEKVVGEPLGDVAGKLKTGVPGRSVAEVIDDPKTSDAFARVQDALGKNKDPEISRMADEANLARVTARESNIDEISRAAEVSPYDSGRKIMSRRDVLEGAERAKIKEAYGKVPATQPIKIGDVKSSMVSGLVKFAGPGSGKITPKAGEFLEEVWNSPDDVSLEIVQNWRKRGQSLAASLYRSNEPEAKMSANIIEAFNDSLDTILEKQGGALKEAIDITRGSKQKFNKGIAKQIGKRGDYAERAMKPENVVNAVLKDRTNAEQFMAGIGKDPIALQEVKDTIGVKLRSIVGDDSKLVRWIDQHRDQLQTILEGDYSKIQTIYDDALSRLNVGRGAARSFGKNSQTTPLRNQQELIDEALGIKESSLKKTIGKTALKAAAGAYAGSAFGPAGTFVGGMIGAGQQAAFGGGRKKAMRELYKLTQDPELLSGFLNKRKDLTFKGIMKEAGKKIPNKGVIAAAQAIRTIMDEDNDDSYDQPIQVQAPKPKSTDFRDAPKGVAFAKATPKTTAPRLSNVLKAISFVESAGNPKAVSKAGAQGLMQIMPAMAKAYGIKDPFDPVQSMRGGAAILKDELKRFGDLKLAIAAYNLGATKLNRAIQKAGTRNFEELKKFLPAETVAYVPKVEKYIKQFEEEA